MKYDVLTSRGAVVATFPTYEEAWEYAIAHGRGGNGLCVRWYETPDGKPLPRKNATRKTTDTTTTEAEQEIENTLRGEAARILATLTDTNPRAIKRATAPTTAANTVEF